MAISASLLAANFARLGEEVQRAEQAGVDSFHFDIMDGHYAPNLALVPSHLSALRPYTRLPFHAHLELANPVETLEHFRPLPADLIIVCRDTLADPRRTFARIHDQDAKVGLSLNPDEGVESIRELLPELDLLLILGVFPGFGGQNMQPDTLARIRAAHQERGAQGLTLPIAVDGGIKLENARDLARAGADLLVVGTALFQTRKMGGFLAAFRAAIES